MRTGPQLEGARISSSKLFTINIFRPLGHDNVSRTWTFWAPTTDPCGSSHNQLRLFRVSHFYAPISRCRLLSQNRELCFSRLRVKEARSRRQIQNDIIYNLRYYPSFSDFFENIHLKLISKRFF